MKSVVLVAAIAAAVSCQSSKSKPAMVVVTEAQTRWLQALEGDDAARWREAELMLAKAGPASLPALERAAGGSSQLADRALETLQLSLRRNTSWHEVAPYPTLAALALPRVERGQRLARQLDDASAFEENDAVLIELESLGGFSVPAARRLMDSKSPVARAFGLEAVIKASATVALPRVIELTHDEEPYRVGTGGAFGAPSSLATHAVKRFQTRGTWGGAEAWVSLITGDDDLARVMRERTVGMTFSDESQWWAGVLPMWNQWWSMVPPGGVRPVDLDAWRAHWTRLDGFVVEQRDVAVGTGVLTVTGPAGAKASISWNGSVAVSGPLPLRVDREPSWVTTAVEVTFADGKKRKHELRFDRRHDMNLTVFAQ